MKAYVVEYMGNIMKVFSTEEEANDYSDRFGGVYGVYPVDVQYAIEYAVDSGMYL